MRLLFDECVAVGLAEVLRAAGHDVVCVQDVESGATDDRVMALAAADDRLLVTVDKDFGELALRCRIPVPGVVLIRIPPSERHRTGPRLVTVLAEQGERLHGCYTVVQSAKIRLRPLLSAET